MELVITVIAVLPAVVFTVQLYCYSQYYRARHPTQPRVKARVAPSHC